MADLQYLPLKEDWVSREVFSASNLNEMSHTINELGAWSQGVVNDSVSSSASTYSSNKIKSIFDQCEVGRTIKITYRNLYSLCVNGELVPGQTYQITDYRCTSTADYTKVASHAFDIIVTADTEFMLNENVSITTHQGESYFGGCVLDAWKAKYSIYNDAKRFSWADEQNGTGVIYYLKDDLENECGYDFKNITFSLQRVTGITFDKSVTGDTAFTSSIYETFFNRFVLKSSIPIASSEAKYVKLQLDEGDIKSFYTFSLNGDDTDEVIDGTIRIVGKDNENTYYQNIIKPRFLDGYTGKQSLNYIVFKQMSKGTASCYGNIIGEDSHDITIGHIYTRNNVFGSDCSNNILGDICSNNVFGNSFKNNICSRIIYRNKFNGTCSGSIFGDNFSDNVISNYFMYNKLGCNCYGNSIGYSAKTNNIGSNFCNNIIGNVMSGNTIENSCISSVFGNDFCLNTIKANCSGNTFGNDSDGNILGIGCLSNSFGNSFRKNAIGSGCSYNSFGNGCERNELSNRCIGNSFGNVCSGNTLGIVCQGNKFGNDCHSNRLESSCNRNRFENACFSNHLNSSCDANIFESECSKNFLGVGCNDNRFGNSCFNNNLEGECSGNTFGINCRQNTTAKNFNNNTINNDCSSNRFGYYFCGNELGNGVNFLNFYTNYTGSTSNDGIKYIKVLGGTAYSQLTDVPTGITVNAKFCQFVGFDSMQRFVIKNTLD